MKLKTAFLCLECEELFENYQPCPSCANTKVVPIQQWLYRERQLKPPDQNYKYSISTPNPYKKVDK